MRHTLRKRGYAHVAAAGLLAVLIAFAGPGEASLIVDEEVNLTGTIGVSGEGPLPSDPSPPDTMGAVGPKHVVELNNKAYTVYLKGTNIVTDQLSITEFFQKRVGLNVDIKAFDPRILYDTRTERWMAIAIDRSFDRDPPVSNSILVAASKSSDPNDGWVGASLNADQKDGTHWADFPRLGVNEHNVTITAKMGELGKSGGTLQSIWVIPKSEFLNGNPASGLAILKKERTEVPDRAQPIVDMEPLSGTPVKSTLIGVTDSDQMFNYNPARVEWFAGSGPVLGPMTKALPTLDSMGPGTVGAAGPAGTSVVVATDGVQFTGNVVFQNGSYWAAHTVNDVAVQQPAAIEWMQIDAATNTVLQHGIIRDEKAEIRSLYYPSIAVNDSGQVFVGFSGSSGDRFIGAYGAAGNTVNGITEFSDLIEIRAGLSPYERIDTTQSPSRNRWGDYSATVVDPSDDNLFWTFQEFAPDPLPAEPNRWATVTAAYRLTETATKCCAGSYSLVEIKQLQAVNEAGFEWAKSVDVMTTDGTAHAVDGRSVRVPFSGQAGSAFSLAFQGDPGNYLHLDGLEGFLNGTLVADAFDTVGVPPLFRFDKGEAFVDFFNPYDFLLSLSNVELYAGIDLSILNLFDFAVPTGKLVDGVPKAFDLWPGQTFRLSFGDLDLLDHSGLLAIADFARADKPEVLFHVAAAASFTVPEPATVALLGLGLAGIGYRRYRSKKAA